MLTIDHTRSNPFAYRVTGAPDGDEHKVDVTFTESVHRYASGPVLGRNGLFNTGEGTAVYPEEARWLSAQGVIQESY
jgi:hypothetical protein